MYLDHFGLSEAPFRITPHTDFFFAGGNRGATLDALIYAITHDEGIVKISGEVGSGKTMLCRVLMERLPSHVTIIYLANPSLSREDILYAIADELNLDVPTDARAAMVLRLLQEHLIKSYSEGRQVVVLIDEAHAMPAETLEEIRLLSNLESNRNKLLQLALFGQPELNEVLARPDMRQLKERITHNFALEPLIRDDIASYLDFRMRAAGYRGPNVFTEKALQAIAKSSQGLTRRINILADKCLLAAYSAGSHEIGLREAQAAIKDCDFSAATLKNTKGISHQQVLLGLALLLATLIGALAASLFREPPLQPEITAQATEPIADKPIKAITAEAVTPPPTIPTIITPPPAPEPQVKESPGNSETLMSQSLAKGNSWLRTAENQRWFLQLLRASGENPRAIEVFLKNVQKAGVNMEKVRVYDVDIKGAKRLGVIYGDFDSRNATLNAIKELPASVKAVRPYPRQVAQLR